MLLCDFHREQAWERWTTKTSHGVAALKEEVLARLRRIAHASTITDCNKAVSDLKDWHVWKSNALLRNWFQETWLQEKEVSLILNPNTKI